MEGIRKWWAAVGILLTLLEVQITRCDPQQTDKRKPNFVVFYADDLGWADLASYGHPSQEFGPIDRMAMEGTRFTQWYSPDTLCTPSRTSLLTGRLPLRSGMIGGWRVHLPYQPGGLAHSETTIAEALKEVGYTTGITGKWHLGINKDRRDDGYYLPTYQGFDYVGHILPLSLILHCDETKVYRNRPMNQLCFLYKNTTIVQQPINLKQLTSTFVQDAKAFIYNNTDNPFFLYFPLAQTHRPMFNHPNFQGKSKRGVYGDQVNEMAWAVGEVLDTLRQLHLDKNTLALFISDHGPHTEICTEGGEKGMFKGGKANYFEGGIRVPSIAWWPGTVPAQTVSNHLLSSLDIYSTLIDIAGGTIPEGHIQDGHSIKESLLGTGNNSHKKLFFYCDDALFAVRYKDYKIHYQTLNIEPHNFSEINCPKGIPKNDVYFAEHCSDVEVLESPLLYNVERDPGERYPLPLDENQALIQEIKGVVDEHRKTVHVPGKFLDVEGHPASTTTLSPCCNPPYFTCNYVPEK